MAETDNKGIVGSVTSGVGSAVSTVTSVVGPAASTVASGVGTAAHRVGSAVGTAAGAVHEFLLSRCLSIAWSTQASSTGYMWFPFQYSVSSSVGSGGNRSGSCKANTSRQSASCSRSRQSIPGVGCGSGGQTLSLNRRLASFRVSGTGE